MKTCTRCSTAQPLEAFGVASQNPDGLKRWCKPCAAGYFKQWNAANPDKRKARKARYFQNNKQAITEKIAAYRKLNPEQHATYYAKWKARNPDKRRQVSLDWAKRNSQYMAMKSTERRARKLKATPIWASDEFEQLVIAEAYDLAKLRTASTGVPFHVDHVVPLKGKTVCGLHCAANLKVIPAAVNWSKNNRIWPEMPL